MRPLSTLFKRALSLSLSIVAANYASAEVTLSSADLHVLPEGETITVTGTDLAGATAARMIWSSAGMQFLTTVNPLDANTLEVVMPVVWQEHRDHHLLIETPSGSTIGIPNGYDEHTGIGTATDPHGGETMVVRAGAVLTGDHYYRTVIVETGGVFEVADNFTLSTIIAQDGAVIDFSAIDSSLDAILLYSPDTVIIGTIPTNPGNPFGGDIGEEITSISISYGLETFTVGYELDIIIEGPGTVTVNPDKQYYSRNENV